MNTSTNAYGADSVREYNKNMIFNLIRTSGLISRAGLTKATKMSPTSIGRIVGNLIEEGFVREVGTTAGGLGRRATLVEVNPDGLLAFGVNIDVPNMHVGVVDLTGKIISYESVEGPEDHDVDDTLGRITDSILRQYDGLDGDLKRRICGIGVTVPGHVLWKEGLLDFSPQLGWKQVAIRERLKQMLGVTSLYVENDVKAAAIAEGLYGAAVDTDDFVVIQLGSGMGAAVVNNGELLRGADNIVGEIGHMIVEPGGQLCDCGRYGCLQTFVCISGIERRSGRSFAETLAAARDGDDDCGKILKQAEQYMAMWTANLKNLYNPQKILFYGRIFQEWPELIEEIRRYHSLYDWNIAGEEYKIQLINLPSGETGMDAKQVSVQSAAAQVFHDLLTSNLPQGQTRGELPFFGYRRPSV